MLNCNLEHKDFAPLKLLLVDDEVDLVEMLAEGLHRHFIRSTPSVFTADTADKALAILHHHPDVDVMVTDYQMPGKNGLALTRDVERLGYLARIVVVSGHCDLEAHVKAFGVRPALLVKKPYTIANIAKAVKSLCRRTLRRQPSIFLSGNQRRAGLARPLWTAEKNIALGNPMTPGDCSGP